MTIITQHNVFVNYDHVVKISVYGDVAEDNEVGYVDVAIFRAHLDTGKKVDLGMYAEDDQLESVVESLTQWIEQSEKKVFKMPAAKLYVEESAVAETKAGDESLNE